MINTSEFSKRLKIVLEYYQLSASSFAEKIKVQRSSISHLLSGRNKPSLDFVLKVLNEFKEVELYWLLNGKGQFPKKENHPLKEKDFAPTLFSKNIDLDDDVHQEHTKPKSEQSSSKSIINNSEIERIVIFYKNGRFKEYTH